MFLGKAFCAGKGREIRRMEGIEKNLAIEREDGNRPELRFEGKQGWRWKIALNSSWT